jgi:phage terminase Nu1 subunit (DNA packaging protein)
MTQAAFGALVGISQQAVSELIRTGVLGPDDTADEWLLAYCLRLREQAAGRASDGPLDLAQERAALAREQRLGLEIKNATLRHEYKPLSWLCEVLATASQAVAERFDHLPGVLKKECPELGDIERDRVMAVLATARNEWVRQTSELVAEKIITIDDEDDQPELVGLDDEPRSD